MPKISIIIPTYNRVETLPRAVQSVFDQTFQDFEVVIVDDGSTDRTPEYCATLNSKDVRIIRFEENRGGNSARNEGINNSTGALIAFLDDDDVWMPAKLEKQVAIMERGQCAMCYTGKTVVYRVTGKRRYSLIRPKYGDMHKSIMRDNFIGSTSSVLIRRDVLEKLGLFDTQLPALQDYDMYIRIIANGNAISCCEEPLFEYTIDDEKESISSGFDSFKQASRHLLMKFSNDPYIFLLRRGLTIITLKRMVKSRRFLIDIAKSWGRWFTGRSGTR